MYLFGTLQFGTICISCSSAKNSSCSSSRGSCVRCTGQQGGLIQQQQVPVLHLFRPHGKLRRRHSDATATSLLYIYIIAQRTPGAARHQANRDAANGHGHSDSKRKKLSLLM